MKRLMSLKIRVSENIFVLPWYLHFHLYTDISAMGDFGMLNNDLEFIVL